MVVDQENGSICIAYHTSQATSKPSLVIVRGVSDMAAQDPNHQSIADGAPSYARKYAFVNAIRSLFAFLSSQ